MPADWILETHEYQVIAEHYGDRCARRSGVRLLQHIDEGIALLRCLRAAPQAQRAYCLHPILQPDAQLSAVELSGLTADPVVMALAMEYRSVANAYLSPMGDRDPADIRLSPLEAVNDMLRADKVHNYKDFLRYHAKTHPRRAALQRYFQAWLVALGIDEQFESLVAGLEEELASLD